MTMKLREHFVMSFVTCLHSNSVADPERFDADPDPTFQADADPDPNPFTRVKKMFFKSSTIVSKVSQNLSL